MLNLVVPTVTITLDSAIYNFQYDLMWTKLSLLGTAQFLSILSSARLAAAAITAVIPSSMPHITNLPSTDHMLDAIPKNEVDDSVIKASRRKHHWPTSLSLPPSPSPQQFLSLKASRTSKLNNMLVSSLMLSI
jgi:hypothetical protein